MRTVFVVFLALATLCVSAVVAVSGETEQGTPKESKANSTAQVVPFKDAYCAVEGPLFIMAKAGATFQFGPQVEHSGKKFQIQKPVSTNAYGVSSITVQTLTKAKEPVGAPKTLECVNQQWNETDQTVDFHFGDENIKVTVQIYPAAMGGFVIKGVKCAPADVTK